MKFDYTWTGNWKNAFRGLRHPYESYNKSDSDFGIVADDYYPETATISELWLEAKNPDLEECFDEYYKALDNYDEWLFNNCLISNDEKNYFCNYALIGPNDMELAQRMVKAGTPNDKFLRQIFVSVDITAPLYWWKEMDTYKVGTTANSTSTMHKLASTPITMNCFEIDDYKGDLTVYDNEPYQECFTINDIWEEIINHCETLRLKYLETKDQKYWKELIRLLPESWLQTRTWTANYAILRNIIHWRKGHRLKYEWDSFLKWCESLPYAKELLFYENGFDEKYTFHDLLSQKQNKQ